MITLLSPAKSLHAIAETPEGETRVPFPKETHELVKILKGYNQDKLGDLMHLSDNLALLNYKRYQTFSSRYTNNNSASAALQFAGDVYRGLDMSTWDKRSIDYSQNHLRILSGLYGLLRPLDKMQPYRLEMGTKLKNKHGSNLYAFWSEKVTALLNKELKKHKVDIIVNLASKEYFKVVSTKQLNSPVINVEFKEYRNGDLKIISFNAKRARGLMAKFIMTNRIDTPQDLSRFDSEDYKLSADSDEHNLLFIR